MSVIDFVPTKHKPNPVVGSSQNSSGGLVSNSLANESRFFSPPDNAFPLSECPIRVSMQPVKPSFTKISLTNLNFSDFVMRRSSRRFALRKRSEFYSMDTIPCEFDAYHECYVLQNR